ncbi:MAG: hypothetical protein ACJ741_03675 [Pyrinomonadaceae bacterium]
MSDFKARFTSVLGYAHLVYLGLLPALATFSLLFLYGHPAPLLLLLAGTAAVGVYLAVIITYTTLPTSPGWALFVLLDGPGCVALSLVVQRDTSFAFAIRGFLVDGTAIWIAILILAVRLFGLTNRQSAAAIGFMLASLVATASLVWPYYRDVLREDWISVGLLSAGVVEATIIRLKLLQRDEVVRDSNMSAAYIIVLILVWVAALILGNVLHGWSWH